MLFFICLPVLGQYPYERYPALSYQTLPWTIQKAGEAAFTGVIQFQDYRLEFYTQRLADSSNVLVFRQGHKIGAYREPDMLPQMFRQPVQVADIDRNGLQDLKVTLASLGASPLAAAASRKIYFFNEGKGFKKISFSDLSQGPERDFNGDGNYEIITKELVSYQHHSYWKFDIYGYQAGTFLNKSRAFRYPIFIRFLNRPNFKVTQDIPPAKARFFISASPPEFSQQ